MFDIRGLAYLLKNSWPWNNHKTPEIVCWLEIIITKSIKIIGLNRGHIKLKLDKNYVMRINNDDCCFVSGFRNKK